MTRQPTPAEAHIIDDDGETTAGLILFTIDGYLSCLEVYFASDPRPLPNLDQIRTYVNSG